MSQSTAREVLHSLDLTRQESVRYTALVRERGPGEQPCADWVAFGLHKPFADWGDSIYGQYFPGTIAEIRIYNRALSAAEILSDMNTAITP